MTVQSTGRRDRRHRGRSDRLRILMVASEMAPWAKTGGLGDVLAGLPASLASLGHEVTVVVPRYRGIDAESAERSAATIRLGRVIERVEFRPFVRIPGPRTVFVDAPRLFDREGYYGTAAGDHSDNAERFAVLAAAALAFAEADPSGPPDVIHAHDWQAGLVPTLLATEPERWPALRQAGRVFTVHNLAYQGRFPPATVERLGLSPGVMGVDGGESRGEFSYLKAGISYADQVTTVSRGYRRETLTPEFGFGLEGALAAKAGAYVGILNGVDTEVWNPAADRWLPARYDADDLSGKTVCKRALLDRFGLPVDDAALVRPLVGMVSRLVDQKGLDLIQAAGHQLLSLDAAWVFLGSGEARYEAFLRHLAERAPGRVGVVIGFDEALAHLIEAGADLYLMPSRFEPCGLNQMYSLRYGTVPVVRAVGGLDDTVRAHTPRARRPNGFKFRRATSHALMRAVRQALRVFDGREKWRRLVRQGMSEDHSWGRPAAEYVKVYSRARHQRAARGILASDVRQRGNGEGVESGQ